MKFHLLTRDVERANLTRELRLRTIFLVAESVRGVTGDMAEVGVYKGRSAQLIARTRPEKTLHLFDTFEGMPKLGTPVDHYQGGEFSDTSLEEVRSRLDRETNCVFHKGVFPRTTEPIREKTFALAHYDGDIYQSCVDFINCFWPRLSRGGALIFDDYDWPLCHGVRKAIEEADLDVVEAVDYQAIVFKR